jgi:hypothetical protein
MKRFIVLSMIVVVGLLVPALPAAGCEPRCAGGDLSDSGLLAEARRQMTELNRGYGGNPAPNCSDEHDQVLEDGNDTVEHEGWLRWVPDFANDPTPPDGVSNEWYQQVCHIPGGADIPLTSWQRFDAVAPEILAQVAIDNMLAGIPQHTIETNPDITGLVAIDTWFWIEGGGLEPVSATASVPGVTVVATAEPGGVEFDFGDGTTGQCEGAGTPYSEGATSACTHEYQAAGTYTVTATIRWTGSYTVNGGAPVPIETVAERTASDDLPVEEAQAINTGTGG